MVLSRLREATPKVDSRRLVHETAQGLAMPAQSTWVCPPVQRFEAHHFVIRQSAGLVSLSAVGGRADLPPTLVYAGSNPWSL
jgi:hypothetical protein